MANEVSHNWDSGETLYFCVFQLDGDVFLSNGESDEVWGTGVSDADTYDMTMTESGDSGHYVGTFDTSIAEGVYYVAVYLQAGANPDDDDTAIGQGVMFWDGTAELNQYTLNAQMDALSAQKSQILNVYEK